MIEFLHLFIAYLNLFQELRDKGILRSVKKELELEKGTPNGILKTIPKTKDIDRDYSMDSKCRARKYIIGYTGNYLLLTPVS